MLSLLLEKRGRLPRKEERKKERRRKTIMERGGGKEEKKEGQKKGNVSKETKRQTRSHSFISHLIRCDL